MTRLGQKAILAFRFFSWSNILSSQALTFSLFLTFLLFLMGSPKANAQEAYFSAPDTICLNDSLVVINDSREADTYYWNFCSGNLSYNPEGTNIGNPGTLDGPAFIDFAEDEGIHHSFVTNHNNGTISRNTYGNDFLATPVSENLGSFGGIIPRHAQGIQVIEDGGNWYVFMVGGQREDSRLIRLDFGNSLANDVANVVNYGNLGDIDYPVDLFITQDQSEWVGFTVNRNTNSLTRFHFENGLNTMPAGENLGNPGNFNAPCGVFPVKENGSWYMFVTNYDGHEITRLDFGISLLNTPSGVLIGDNTLLHHPFDLTILRDCERTYGFVVNRFNDVVRLDFQDGLEAEPVFTSLGNIGGLYNPQGISDVFRVGDNLYAFVANIDNSTLTRLVFPGCNNASPPSSTDRNPPPIYYDSPGIYNINLVIDEGQPDQETYCRYVVVTEDIEFSLGNDTLIPAGSEITLGPDSSYASYYWSTESTEQQITVNEAGTYQLTITNRFGCEAADEIDVILDIGIPNFFTPNNDGTNDTWNIPFLYNKPEARIAVFDRFGNMVANYKYGEKQWDGTHKGRELPEGTYWYIIEVPGMEKPYKGGVTIKR